MGDWVFFDADPATGTTIWMRMEADEKIRFRIEQQVDPILTANVAAEKLSHGRRLPEWNRFASVPLRMVENTGLDLAVSMRDQRYIAKILNDGDNQKFRTSRGRL